MSYHWLNHGAWGSSTGQVQGTAHMSTHIHEYIHIHEHIIHIHEHIRIHYHIHMIYTGALLSRSKKNSNRYELNKATMSFKS